MQTIAFLNMTIIVIIFQKAQWNNGTKHQMTLYSAVIVAGGQTLKRRLFVHLVRSIVF
jgi:hypothetical protein